MGTWPGAIGAITLVQEDLAAAKRFYADVFGLPVEDVDATCATLAASGVSLLNGPMDRP